MPINSSQNSRAKPSFWRWSIDWMYTLDEALSTDPSSAKIAQLSGEVAELKAATRRLEDQLEGGSRKPTGEAGTVSAE